MQESQKRESNSSFRVSRNQNQRARQGEEDEKENDSKGSGKGESGGGVQHVDRQETEEDYTVLASPACMGSVLSNFVNLLQHHHAQEEG